MEICEMEVGMVGGGRSAPDTHPRVGDRAAALRKRSNDAAQGGDDEPKRRSGDVGGARRR
jgi:hypothetical protein